MRNEVLRSILIVAVLLGFATTAYAQLTGQITGTITDPSGGVVPTASVTVVNEDTGIKWDVKTNSAGIYQVPLLQPGNYRISVQSAGFREITRSGIRLEVAQTVLVNFQLEVGAAVESVNVTETAPLLDAGSNAIGGVVTPQQVEDLPMLGRNVVGLVTEVPGVRATRQTTLNPVLESHYQFFSINGSRPTQSQFMLDGGNDTNGVFNGPEYSPQVEEVQEFKIQTSNFSAEYGNSAGWVVNIVSKSGTNALHGSLFEYFRNDVLAANDFFSNKAGSARPMLRYNQFGGTAGGPIVRNRTFFFFGYEGLREEVPIVVTTSVPTALQRTGDFSQTLSSSGKMVMIYDPTSTVPDPNSPGNYVRAAFPGNRIPASRIDPVAAKIETYYPAPTSAGNPNTGLNNFFFSGPAPRDMNTYSGRVDHQLNASTLITARFSWASLSTWTNPPTFGYSDIASPGYAMKPQHHPYVLGRVTKTFSPTLIGEFVVSWAGWVYESIGLSYGFDPTQLGFPSYLAQSSPSNLSFPVISQSEMSNLGGYTDQHTTSDRYEGKANLSKVYGKHILKFGGMYGLVKYYSEYPGNTGSYTFSTAFTQGPNPLVSSTTSGFGLASFLLGTMASGVTNSGEVHDDSSSPYSGVYIQDDYRITSRLTLNLGLRWEHEDPRVDAKNRVSNFSFTGTTTASNGTVLRGGLLFPGVGGLPRGNWNSNTKDFAPRFGFAYSLKDSMVFRGGYGIFYSNSWGSSSNSNAMPQSGFVCQSTVVTSLDNGLTPYAVLSNPFPTGFCTRPGSSAGLLTALGQQVYIIDRNAKQPYMQSWNFGIQRKLPWSTVAEISYSGSRGIHLMGDQEWDQLAPQYLSLGSQLNTQVPNPFYGVITLGQLATPTITLGQSLRPYPQFLGVTSTNADYGNSIYHAMFLRVQHRMSKGLSVMAAYTRSKEIDDMIPSPQGFPGESFFAATPQNFYNLRGERALSAWDTPQTLVLSYVYELPFGPGKPLVNRGGALGKMIGGWQINGTTTFMSGIPLQVSGGNASGSFAGLQRPNWNGQNPTLSGAVTSRLLAYFNTSEFSFNAPFTFGNAPRMMPDLRGPGTDEFDLSLFKNTQIREKWQLQFRAEAFNAFNRVQFGVPNVSINSSAFGVISSQQNSPRNIQLGLRLLF